MNVCHHWWETVLETVHCAHVGAAAHVAHSLVLTDDQGSKLPVLHLHPFSFACQLILLPIELHVGNYQ